MSPLPDSNQGLGEHAKEAELVLALLLSPPLFPLLPPLLLLQVPLQPRFLQGQQALFCRLLPGQEAGQGFVQTPLPAATLTVVPQCFATPVPFLLSRRGERAAELLGLLGGVL